MESKENEKIITLSTLTYYDEKLKKWILAEIKSVDDKVTKLINDFELEII